MRNLMQRAICGMRPALHLGAAVLFLASAGCDFEVANPGPIHDENLDDAGAHSAVVNGAMGATLRGLSEYAISGGGVSRDFHAGGHTGWAGVALQFELGQLDDQTTETTGWSEAHNGRFIGEHMSARIRETMGAEADDYLPLAEFHLWAAFANRILGEHVCTAVLDDGPEPWTAHFTRAVEHFTAAEEVAAAAGNDEIRLAAIGGRASAHLYLGNWDQAEADASEVPPDFTFRAQYTDQHPDFYWLTEAVTTTFRSATFWHHPFEEYFPETGDPRAAWGHDPDEEADVARPSWGEIIPMYYPLKLYQPRNKPDELEEYAPVTEEQHATPINLVSGREMLLIRAEAELVRGRRAEGMELINEVRTTAFDPGTGDVGSYFTGEPLEPVEASTLEEAWAALKWERLLELNLEGRRFGDRKRWAVNETPGDLHPLELLPDHHVEEFGVPKEPNVCFPMPESEKDRNQEVPTDFQDEIVSG